MPRAILKTQLDDCGIVTPFNQEIKTNQNLIKYNDRISLHIPYFGKIGIAFGD